MYIKNERLRTLFRILLLIACEAGLILEYAEIGKNGGARILTCYYTILSNFLCFFYFVYLVAFRPKKEHAWLRGSVTMCIAVTGLVYHLLLTGLMQAGGAANAFTPLNIANTLVHTVVPLLVVLDYFLFFPKGQYKSLHPLLWLLLPLLYFGFAMLRAEISDTRFTGFGSTPSRFPYPFLDVDIYGWDKVLLFVLGVAIAFTALGYLAYVIDRFLGKVRVNRK